MESFLTRSQTRLVQTVYTISSAQQICLQLGASAPLTIKSEKPQEGLHGGICEAQGKGRAKGRLRKVTQRSFIDYRLSIIDILSLELTLNLVATFPPTGRLISLN